MPMNSVEKSSINALAAAIKSAENKDNEIGGQTAADFINALLSEPDKKKRTQMMRDFSARHKDVARFIAENADLINAEAEAALIGAAVGGKKAPPNVTALKFFLKNKLPGKYSDKPVGDTEIEDVSDIREALYEDKD